MVNEPYPDSPGTGSRRDTTGGPDLLPTNSLASLQTGPRRAGSLVPRLGAPADTPQKADQAPNHQPLTLESPPLPRGAYQRQQIA